MASSKTRIARLYSSDDRWARIWFPGLFKIMRHWSKWWCSIVDVEYNWANGDDALQNFKNPIKNSNSIKIKWRASYLIWNELLVPLWSKSWHKHAIISAKHSISPKIFHHCVDCWRMIINISMLHNCIEKCVFDWIITVTMENIICATLKACRQLW